MSKVARTSRRGPDAPRALRAEWTADLVAIGFLVAALLSGLALLTHDPGDASWGAVGEEGQRVANAVGPFGANLSYALFEALGHVAHAVPLVLLTAAFLTFFRRRIRLGLARMTGAVLLVLAGAMLVDLSLGAPGAGGSFPPGGFLGRLLAAGLASALGSVGAGIVAGGLAACALLLITQLSVQVALDGGVAAGRETAGRLAAALGSGLAAVRGWLSRRPGAAGPSARERRPAGASVDRRRPRREPPAIAGRPTRERRRWLGLSLRIGRRGSAPPAGPEVERAEALPATSPERPAARERTRAAEREASLPVARTAPPVAGDTAAEVAGAARTGRSAFAPAAEAPSGAARPSLGARATVAKAVRRGKGERDYRLPPTSLLGEPEIASTVDEADLMKRARRIVEKCAEFGVGGQVLQIHPGPVVTTFELKPDAGVKLSRICGLEDDLAMALKAETIRIDRIPGKSTVGIEVPNRRRELISFRELAESDVFEEASSPLTMILGKTIDGAPEVADLTRMPHLLIAGSTGSGKSVSLNALITSILFKAGPDRVKFIMVDPKMLELGMYRDIPHLLTPVVTNAKLASNALKWGVREMEQRYALLAGCGVRNIEQYNAWVERETKARNGGPVSQEGREYERLPYVVIVIDELADLMMVAASDVEDSICRLAQMARAVGIHLILATQRPSVDVITGVIKANLPARIAMRVASKIDSRTILDTNGAEQLLGKGDMLFLPSGSSRLVRVHGPYISETETARICDHLRTQRAPEYDDGVCEDPATRGGAEADSHDDELFDQAARIVVDRGEASTSYLQRRLKVGYSRAARLVDMLEADGIVGPSEGSKVREVLVGPEYFQEIDRARADGA